jgi:hypothetical protein
MKLRVALGLLVAAGPARAVEPSPAVATAAASPDESTPRPPVRDEIVTGSVLPRSLYPVRKDFWVVGIGVERFAAKDDDVGSLEHFLVGVTGMWRTGPFAPHALLMMHPSGQHENLRFLGGLGFRGYIDVPGFTELSVGVGTHAEIRLEDHYWLWYLTPLEVGGVVVRNRTFELEVFLGVRRAIAGYQIDHFLIDPNGFDNEVVKENLERETGEDAWKGFLRVVFARRLD